MNVKNKYTHLLSILIGLISAVGSVYADTELACERFSLKFAGDGRPSSLNLMHNDQQLLNIRTPGAGFYIRYEKSDLTIPLEKITRPSENYLLASTSNDNQQVLFRIHRALRHISFHIEQLRGFPVASDLTLHFEMNTSGNVGVWEHDYMTEIRKGSEGFLVSWNYLWQRSQGDSLGGFSVYYYSDPADEDETLLHIWAQEGLVHPEVDGTWDVQTARNWLKEWQSRFKDRALWSQFSLMYFEPETLEDLYSGARYAQKAGVSALYLMPWSWRGEYWLNEKTTVGINTDIFPRGEADLKAFSQYCRELGLGLELHYVSGGVGFRDPRYVRPRPDPRLAGWGNAVLLDSADPKMKTLRIKLDASTQLPYRTPTNTPWEKRDYRYPALTWWFNYDIIQIENELIKVGRFTNECDDIWILDNCERGFADTPKLQHAQNAAVKGLITAYDQNFVPDNNSSLLTEIAAEYADFLNRNQITQAVFDGIEIHRFFGYGQGERFVREVYRRLKYPMVTHDSGGRPPRCWMEYHFNSTRALLGTAHGAHADIICHHPSREATSLLEAHHALGQAAARNSRAYGVRSGDRGMTLATLQNHGLTDKILKTVSDWRRVDKMLKSEQRQSMLATEYADPHYPLMLAGNHPKTPLVYTLEETSENWRIYPSLVMTRESGDVEWYSGQEHGSVAPKQYIKPNQDLLLENPYHEQSVHFIIKVLFTHDYEHADNINLLPDDMQKITNAPDTILEPGRQSVTLSYRNPRATEMWQEKEWPHWPVNAIDLQHHRAMGLWVTGDGSQSVLILNLFRHELEQRDYVIPLDFVGRRYIEIPHGQVAWAQSQWGWCQRTWKFFDYSQVHRICLGWGHVPALTNAKAAIEGVKALKELPSILKNPVIQAGSGKLQIVGEIKSEEYLEYDGGDLASVYDKNWNLLRQLPVHAEGYRMETGRHRVRVVADMQKGLPWLETQFIVRDKPIIAPKNNTDNPF